MVICQRREWQQIYVMNLPQLKCGQKFEIFELNTNFHKFPLQISSFKHSNISCLSFKYIEFLHVCLWSIDMWRQMHREVALLLFPNHKLVGQSLLKESPHYWYSLFGVKTLTIASWCSLCTDSWCNQIFAPHKELVYWNICLIWCNWCSLVTEGCFTRVMRDMQSRAVT